MDLLTAGFIILGLTVIAAISAGTALGLHLIKPGWSALRRIMWSASISSLGPMSLPLLAFFLEGDLDDPSDFALGLLALFITTGVLWSVIGLPAAWWVSRRMSLLDSDASALDDNSEDTKLIGSEA